MSYSFSFINSNSRFLELMVSKAYKYTYVCTCIIYSNLPNQKKGQPDTCRFNNAVGMTDQRGRGWGKGWTASMNVIFSDKGMRWYSTVLSRCFCLAVLLCTGKYSKFFLLLLYIKIILNYR